MRRLAILLLALCGASHALAQGTLLQGGPWAPGHAPMYVGQGSGQAVVQDGGPAGGGAVGVGLSELGLTARGTGTPPYVGQGTGPNGTNFCDFDAPTTNAAGYHFLCFSPNATAAGVTGGQLIYGSGGGATPLPFYLTVNGTSVVPGGGFAALTVGSTLIASGTNNCIAYDLAGVLACSTTLPTGTSTATATFGTATTQLATTAFVGAAFSGMTGDCTATAFSVITCLKTNGTAFGTIAAQNSNSVAITGGTITGMPTPVNASDVAIKSYVDGASAGLTILAPSTYATAAILPNSPTYANGSLGVGATLTAGSNSTLTVDGTVAALNSVVLVNNQAAPAQNGIYTVTTAGSGSAAWVLTRATYFNQASNMLKGSYTFISGGTANINSSWVLAATTTTVGTTAVNFNQFTQANGVVTFCGLTGIVTATQATACLNQFTSSLQGLVSASGGGTSNYLRADNTWNTPPAGTVDNLLPNVQNQLWSGVQFITKQNAAGTAAQTALSCSGFNTTNANPTITCANTQTLRVNDLIWTSIVGFWGYAGVGYINCGSVNCTAGLVTSNRVTTVTTNTSVVIASPGFGGVSPAASAAVTLTPIAPGAASGTNGADGWTKTGTLLATIDDWGAAATPATTVYPGCERPLLLRKGITGQEIYEYNVPANAIGRFQGQTVTFGAAVYQRVQGGASTFNLHIDDTTGSTASANGTGSGLGGYQFLSVTRTIAQAATAVAIYINLTGNSGDVFDICLPTAAFVPTMVQSQLKQNAFERVKATSHWNPPLLTPFSITFPTSVICTGCGLYGWNSNDLEALSFGTIHNTVPYVHCKLEWTSTTVGKNVFFGGNVNTTNGLTFGLQAATQVSGVVFPTNDSSVPLYHDGTVAFYTDSSAGLVPTSGTFDCGDIETGSSNSVN